MRARSLIIVSLVAVLIGAGLGAGITAARQKWEYGVLRILTTNDLHIQASERVRALEWSIPSGSKIASTSHDPVRDPIRDPAKVPRLYPVEFFEVIGAKGEATDNEASFLSALGAQGWQLVERRDSRGKDSAGKDWTTSEWTFMRVAD